MSFARPTVLVVEDEEAFVDALTVGLTREGFRVHVARDGVAALERFDVVSPDLVLLDVMLPRLSGLDVCRQLRSRSPVPIVMVSAKHSEIDTVVGLEVGADDYVAKPYRLRELVARMRAALRRVPPAPPRDDHTVLELRETAGGVVAIVDALTPASDEQDSEFRRLHVAAGRLVSLVDSLEAALLEPLDHGVGAETTGRRPSKARTRCALADLLGSSSAATLCGTGRVHGREGRADALRDELLALLEPQHRSRVVSPNTGRSIAGDLVVDLDAQEVSVGTRSSRLPSALLRLLAAMVANPGRLFSREEIQAELWGEGKRSPSVLHSVMNRLRHVLRDELDAQLEIQTVRAAGYRLAPRPDATQRPQERAGR